MNINFNLKSPDKDVSAIRLIISHKGKVYRKNIGISVRTATWKKPKHGKQTTNDQGIAAKLKGILLNLESRLNDLSTENQILDAMDEVLAADGSVPRKKRDGRPTFWEYFDQWVTIPCKTQRFRLNAKKRIEELMGRSDDWEDIDSRWYFRLMQKMDAAGWSVNYKSTLIGKLRTVMHEGINLKYHNNAEYRTFRKVWEQPDTIYLTQAEVDTIWEFEPKGSLHRKARDLFILGVYTASRFSDYSRLKIEDIHNGMITFVQQKTSASVIIPAAPRVIEILKRNDGHAPVLSQPQYNKAIKEVCRDIGFNEPVNVTKSKGAEHLTTTIPKWQLVSGHTARRTGATLLYLSGVPLRQCMFITGHTTEENFMRYIRITKEENANKLAAHPFFNQGI